MTKCWVCNSRKGKRLCLLDANDNSLICSKCCGQTRAAEKCGRCEHYRVADNSRQYNSLISYTVEEMCANPELEAYGNIVETAFCSADGMQGFELNDDQALYIFERLIDKYYFNKDPLFKEDEPEIILESFKSIRDFIESSFADVDQEKVKKVIGIVYKVAKRRSCGRNYLNFIQKYVGESLPSEKDDKMISYKLKKIFGFGRSVQIDD